MKTLILLLTLLGPGLMMAQTVERKVVASGGSTTVATASVQVSQTFGEAMVNSHAPGSLIVTEGFQQSGNTAVGIELGFEATTFTVFPNPVGDQLNLRIESPHTLKLDLQFVDVLGKQVPIPAKRITVDGSLSETFDFSRVTTGTYLLLVKDTESGAMKSLQVRKVD